MSRFSKLETHRGDAEAPAQAEAPPLGGAEPATYGATLERAEELFYRGDFKNALRYYSRALQLDNKRPEPWVGQVLALLFMNQTAEAAAWAKRAVGVFPEDPLALSVHALVFAEQGMRTRALATCDYAMARGDAGRLCWLVRGWVLAHGENENWEFCLSKAREMAAPNDWRTPFLVGMALERLRKWPQAIEAYRAALEIQTGNFHLWHRAGLVYARLGLTRKALEAQRAALQLNPRCAAAEREVRRQSGMPVGNVFRRLRSALRRK